MRSSEMLLACVYVVRRANRGGVSSSGINTRGQHSESGQARDEEVFAAAKFDEIREASADKGTIVRICCALNHELAATFVITKQKVFVVALVRVIPVFDPLLLHEFELPEDACVQRHEDDAAILGVVYWLPFWNVLAIRQSTPHNPTPVHQAAIKPERVPRMHAPEMGTQRAARSRKIITVREVRVLLVVGYDGRVGTVGRTFEWRSISPTAYELGGEFFFPARILLPFFIEVRPKGGDILVQFPVHHEATVAAQQMGNWSYGEFSGLVGIAKQELTRGE